MDFTYSPDCILVFLYNILKTKEALDNIRNFIDKQQLTNSDTPKKSTVPNEDKKGIR
uniref:Uncharacterized protein n=1 Tax=Escherichia coli TaxID=562 RepID=A0A2P9EML7_ECOLX|nr:protein of unknown function [Escherichia coli]